MIKYIIRKASNYTNGIGDNRFILWFNWYLILRWTIPIKRIYKSKNSINNMTVMRSSYGQYLFYRYVYKYTWRYWDKKWQIQGLWLDKEGNIRQ